MAGTTTNNEIRKSLQSSLKRAGQKGKGTIVIRYLEGRGTPSGRSDYFDIRLFETVNGRPREIAWITRLIYLNTSWRWNEKRKALMLSGYGYCKSQEIAEVLVRIAGHAIYFQSLDGHGGPQGLVRP